VQADLISTAASRATDNLHFERLTLLSSNAM
jgi:hypothetical protein